jgi:hypothetical protein
MLWLWYERPQVIGELATDDGPPAQEPVGSPWADAATGEGAVLG